MEPEEPLRKNLLQSLTSTAKEFWDWLRTGCHNLKVAFLTKYAQWVDPKLAPYREQTHINLDKQTIPPKNVHVSGHLASTSKTLPAPSTSAEFMDLLKRTPRSVLSQREREIIVNIMNFPHLKVADLMLDKSAITYVKDDEVLGPLTLDRLYRSGFQHFPVLNYDRKIIGVIHTTAFNSLEIKETSRVIEILDPKVCYLREDYTLTQALAAFLRTNCYFFLVVDHYERIVGIFTYEMLVTHLLGESPTDDFHYDSDRAAVAKR